MRYNDPIAYLITFTTYGSRLHGDERGTVDAEHNRYKGPYVPTNDKLKARREQSLNHPPLKLIAAQRGAVERGIRKHCEHKRWHLHALNVRTNHVHLVVGARSDAGQGHGKHQALGDAPDEG